MATQKKHRILILTACAAMQVFRALRPAPTSEACGALLASLHKCMAMPQTPTALRMAVDIVLTLQVGRSQASLPACSV